MDDSTLKNAQQIAGTQGGAVSNGNGKDNKVDLVNYDKSVGEVPKEMIKTRLKMGLTPKK